MGNLFSRRKGGFEIAMFAGLKACYLKGRDGGTANGFLSAVG